MRFIKDVRNLITFLREHYNPFLETGPELLAIDTHDVMCGAVVNSLYQIDEIGKVTHETFVQSNLVDASTSIYNTIPRNSMPTFGYQPSTKEKSVEKLEVLKRNTNLVTQLFLSLRSRPGLDFSDFFTFENHF